MPAAAAEGSAVAGPLAPALTVAQIACAVLLVIAAGLLVRSLWTLSHAIRASGRTQVVTARSRRPSRSAVRGTVPRVLPRARRPGAGGFRRERRRAGEHPAIDWRGGQAVARHRGLHGSRKQTAPLFWLHVITPGYFRVMDMRRRLGPGVHARGFDRRRACRDRHVGDRATILARAESDRPSRPVRRASRSGTRSSAWWPTCARSI